MKLVEHKGHWTPKGSEKAWNRYWKRTTDMDLAIGLCLHRRTVVQAGGNIGAWPVYLAKKKFTSVLTFEPEAVNHACLVKNIAPFPQIHAFHAALGATAGTVKLKVCESIGSHHLVMEKGDTVMTTIDQLGLDDLDLIVADVEGAELLLIQGALGTIARCKPIIQLEDRGHGMKKGFGYEFSAILDTLPDYFPTARVGRDVILRPKS